MDLMCMAKNTINLIPVMYFIGFGVGGLLSFPVLDKIGRLKSHWIFSTIHMLAQIVVVFVPTFSARMAGFTVMGLMMAKNSLCYTWLFEFMLKDHKSLASTAMNMMDFLTCCIGGIFFLFGSQNVQDLLVGFLSVHIFGYIVVTAICPESPKWLLL